MIVLIHKSGYLSDTTPGSSQAAFFSERSPGLAGIAAGDEEGAEIVRDWLSRSVAANFSLFYHIVRHLKKPCLAIQMLDKRILDSQGNLLIPDEFFEMRESRSSQKRDLEQITGEADESDRNKRHCNQAGKSL
ncbi:hypothetical protein [Legionella sp. CNM-4043-24]|uniref:hypothetical protein n=1 Tax=Legionella sp. CNM-4043-24 TaxID=3421646 RepID=UPI00403AA85D